ncbi:MAG: helicase-related protein [Myxococcaceae bacterium]
MADLVPGMKVRYGPQPDWGIGHLVAHRTEDSRALVLFPGRGNDPIYVSTKSGALGHARLVAGAVVRVGDGATARVVHVEAGASHGLLRYRVRLESGKETTLEESELRGVVPAPDVAESLLQGRFADPLAFVLRRSALMLDDERRNDALGALFASRIMVKPHQVGVAQRVLSARQPRFILADEVGLGKTIEAGMIFSALRLSGLVRRVLVVTPSHLTVQWLAELFHKFNQLFTLMDGERYASAREETPTTSPWARFPTLVTSLEFLTRNAEHVEAASHPDAAWDLVIFDEAHHLKSAKALEVARALSKNSWGLLLLTATPMQLDPEEYCSLLSLVDEATAPTPTQLAERVRRQEALSTSVRELLGGTSLEAVKKRLLAHFPDDSTLSFVQTPQAALDHLAETYSLSEHLLRNRRVTVGGFSKRVLVRHSVQPSADERSARDTAMRALKHAEGELKGTVLAQLLRRLDSSTPAFLSALANTVSLSGISGSVQLPRRDSKFQAFQKMLKEVWTKAPQAKVLVFVESKDTLEFLQTELRHERMETLAYHGDLPLVERDRQVARFRDPDGPRLLVCTELGGEGRNFQFAHHLVHYDLPWSPAAVEQRIGRLDRIGQTQPVQIHVFEVEGTLGAEVVQLFADSVGVFEETVGGLDAVLEEVEPRLSELALAPRSEREKFAATLKSRIQNAKAAIREAYDPLLDLRSFDKPALGRLLARAKSRLGVSEEEGESLEEGLHAIARDLDERLEETVTELALRVGIGVDTDENVDAFQCAFHFGHALKVEALPGLDLAQERTVLGSFWRDTAVEQEENHYFATGHPIVEALLGFLRDGPYGRTALRRIGRGATRARGLECVFHLVPTEPQDTTPGARVPSRQLTRFLDRWLLRLVVSDDGKGGARLAPELLEKLEAAGETEEPSPIIETFLPIALAAAHREAQSARASLVAQAQEAILAEEVQVLRRLKRSLAHQGFSEVQQAAQREDVRRHYKSIRSALAQVRVVLDSASVFLLGAQT